MNREHWDEYAANFPENFDESEEARLFLATVNDMQIATVIRFHAGNYYIKWLDQKVPALDYLTPRICLETEEGRNILRAMLMRWH